MPTLVFPVVFLLHLGRFLWAVQHNPVSSFQDSSPQTSYGSCRCSQGWTARTSAFVGQPFPVWLLCCVISWFPIPSAAQWHSSQRKEELVSSVDPKSRLNDSESLHPEFHPQGSIIKKLMQKQKWDQAHSTCLCLLQKQSNATTKNNSRLLIQFI